MKHSICALGAAVLLTAVEFVAIVAADPAAITQTRVQ
jgi:hypothetical protein